MVPFTVTYCKFIGTISLGLLTGVSYSLSFITIPTLLALPSATTASLAHLTLIRRARSIIPVWSTVSTASFLLAYLLSPRRARHPYLLWTAMLVFGSGISDRVLLRMGLIGGITKRQVVESRGEKGKGKGKEKLGRMEASYDVVGDSEEGLSASDEGGEEEEAVNGEEVRKAMEGFRLSQIVRLGLTWAGFMMSVVGIWGDGA